MLSCQLKTSLYIFYIDFILVRFFMVLVNYNNPGANTPMIVFSGERSWNNHVCCLYQFQFLTAFKYP